MQRSLKELITECESRLILADLSYGQGAEDVQDEALRLTLYCMDLKVSSDEAFEKIDWTQEVPDSVEAKMNELVAQRIEKRMPLSYLTNEAWFAGYQFYVDERVIIPRSYLSEWIPDQFEPWVDSSQIHTILDMCTGCGCIGISCALQFPQATVLVSDISEQALAVAEINIKQYGLQKRVDAICSDGFTEISGDFDLIVCNPPYVSDARMQRLPDEFKKEPESAFSGGEEGLNFIIPMLQQAEKFLSANGTLIVEAGSASTGLEDRFPDLPFTWLSTEYDEMVVFVINKQELMQYKDQLVE